MSPWNDRLWMWRGWQPIKWIFGFFLLILVVSQIWCVETVPDYDQNLTIKLVQMFKNMKAALL